MIPANGLRREGATIWTGRRAPAGPASEAEVIAGLQSGSEAVFDWLVRHYHAPVYGLVWNILADRNDAAEVTQAVFLKALFRTGRLGQISSLKAWLYRISVREALNRLPWFCRYARRQRSAGATHGDHRMPEQLESTGSFPFDEPAKRGAHQAMQEALKRIPRRYRAAVILRDLEGLSYEEVAEVLEVSVGRAKSRILRGRRALRDVREPIFATASITVPRPVSYHRP